MENMRINVRQAHSDTYNGNPYIAFAGIMTGLLSVILFVDELDAVSFTVVGVLLFSGIYAYILSYAHYNKRKFLPFVIVGEVAVTAILSVFNIQRISEQSVSIMQALVDGRANTQNVTYVVFVSSVVLIYIIYLLEVIFKNRVILTLVTVVMLAASPILRLEVSLFHIFVIVMHQVIVGVSYAVLGRRKKMLYTTRSGKLIHKKSIIYCIAATVIIFFAADIITNIFSEYMYGSISGIEQTIYKTSKRISGKGSDVKINGEISSGNNYQSGITQMTVTVSNFLFNAQRGYCVHYATVATIMYRLYGVPARYVCGYRLSAEDFKETDQSTYVAEVSDKKMHAWTEIFIDNYGWVPVDVTPASDGSCAVSYPGYDINTFNNVMSEHGWTLDKASISGDSSEDVTYVSTRSGAVKVALKKGFKVAVVVVKYIAILTLVILIVLLPLWIKLYRVSRLRKIQSLSSCDIYERLMEMLHFAGDFTGYNGTEEDFAYKLSARYGNITYEEAKNVYDSIMYIRFADTDKGRSYYKKNVLVLYRKAAEEIYKELKKKKRIVFKYIHCYI